MFGAMIFNSLSLLSLLTIAVTLTVLGFYPWAGLFYALSLLMLTKVGVDTTKDIRTEIKTNKIKKRTMKAEAAAAAAAAAAPSSYNNNNNNMTTTTTTMRNVPHLTDIVEEKAVHTRAWSGYRIVCVLRPPSNLAPNSSF